LLVTYTPSYVYSVRDLGLAYRLAEGSAPKRETRVTEIFIALDLRGVYNLIYIKEDKE
jgi:hypothetical protein